MKKWRQVQPLHILIFIFVVSAIFFVNFSDSTLVQAESAETADSSSTEDEERQRPYTLNADRINYDSQKGLVVAEGKAVLKSRDLQITASKITVEIDKNRARALGEEVLLKTPKQQITGKELEYNYEERTGTFYGARSQLDEVTYRGEKISLVQGKDYAAEVEKASFTPCILPDPHYQVKASSVKIYPEDKIVGEKLVLWWGDLPIMYLPYYVMEYDEEKGKFTNPGPATNFGYDSDRGFFAEITYPYQFKEKSQGKVYYKRYREGDTVASFSNSTSWGSDISWNTDYSYREFYDEDDYLTRDEHFQSNFDYRLTPELHLESTLKYFHEYEEEDNDFDREGNFRLGVRYHLTPNLNLSGGYRYRREYDRDGDYSRDRFLSTGLRYQIKNFSLYTDYDYSLQDGHREETAGMDYRFGGDYRLQIHHYYEDEHLQKRSYSLASNFKSVGWRLRYRRGYDMDYYPYLDLNFPRILNLKPELGLGRVYDEDWDKEVKKARLRLHWHHNFSLTEGLALNLKEDLIYNYYREPDTNPYYGLVSEINGSYDKTLNKRLSVSTSLGWERTRTWGQSQLSTEDMDEESILTSSLGFKIKTDSPQSALIFTNQNEYHLETESWEEKALQVTRQLDCYSLNFRYDFHDKTFSFSIDL